MVVKFKDATVANRAVHGPVVHGKAAARRLVNHACVTKLQVCNLSLGSTYNHIVPIANTLRFLSRDNAGVGV